MIFHPEVIRFIFELLPFAGLLAGLTLFLTSATLFLREIEPRKGDDEQTKGIPPRSHR
jgi:hypothetical protein